MAFGPVNLEALVATHVELGFRARLRALLMEQAEQLVDKAVQELTEGLEARVQKQYDVMQDQTKVFVQLIQRPQAI